MASRGDAAGVSVAVDPLAESSFEAPQRLLSLLGLALVAFLAFGIRSPAGERTATGVGRSAVWVAALAGGAFVAGAASAFGSPHPSMSLDALRGGSLLLLALPVGASVVLEGAHGVRVMAAQRLLGATVLAHGSLTALSAVSNSLQLVLAYALGVFTARFPVARAKGGCLDRALSVGCGVVK